jgi:tetratricopeptide (TPR) repeat protein
LVRIRQREYALAERHYRQAIDLSRDRGIWFAHSNLVAALLMQGNLAAADSLIRVIEARDSIGIVTRRVRDFRAMALHDYDAVITLSRADLAATGRPEFTRAFSLFRLGAALALTGRQRSADSAAAAGEELIARLGDPGLAFRSAVTRAVQLLVLTGDSTTAHWIVSEAERRYAPATLRFLDRRHAQQAVARTVLGDTTGARRILSEWQREVPRELSRVDGWAITYARGELALAERRPKEALSLFRNREFGFCECSQVNVARAFDALREPDSAIVYFERYLRTPGDDGLGLAVEWRPFVLKRLGELYEQQGQRANALESYEAFVALWKNAEPEQQRVVNQVKERIAKLRRATG